MGIYSKKVMDHFKNPHNYGKIKDPDGTGEVGNVVCGDVMKLYIKIKEDRISDIKFETFGCLPFNEKVLTNEGDWIDISLIKEKDSVLNSNGREVKVIKTFTREYNGSLLTIIPFVSRFNSFSLTPEHPVLCIKRNWLKSSKMKSGACKWLPIKEEELLNAEPEYIPAREICEGDYIIFVSNKKVKDSKLFNVELMRLIGYYLAEGYVSAHNSIVAFGFNKDLNNKEEQKSIKEVKDLLFKITGKKPKERTRRTSVEIYICSRSLARFLISRAGKISSEKKLSNDILVLPFKKQWELVSAYIRGDGNIYRRRTNNTPTYRISTASGELAIQIQEILARGRIFSSIKKDNNIERRKYIEGRKVSAKPLFEISFKLERSHKFVHSNNKYFFVPVRKIKKKHYKGVVYNFQVMNAPNSYLVKGFAVHNCAAAISTSSIITDLAKGKTIKEALDIDKDSIVDSLGGLPPIKVHCSVLAVDALSEAIYDYLKKNKKNIPKKLEKIHERLENEKAIIKEKYKKWIK